MVIGGFHLVTASKEQVLQTAATLHGTLKVERVATAHCNSELGFAVLLERFEKRFDRAGVGSVITLPSWGA